MNKKIKKCGFVNILGATNVGKSTLLNSLIEQKISIITRKVQTTRNSIRGVICSGDSQLVIIDTPGIFEPKRKLDRAMINNAWRSMKDVDFTLLMIEAKNNIDDNTLIISKFLKNNTYNNLICVINKIDKVKPESLLSYTKILKEHFNCKEYFYLSALKGYGVKDLKKYLFNNIPFSQWHYPKDQITDTPYSMLVAEFIREKLMDRFHHEIPYGLTVVTEDWNELEDNSIRIDVLIYVQKIGQKKIVVGKNGNNLKIIGTLVRKDLQLMLDKKVHLFLYVKIKSNWDRNPEYFKSLGLDYNV